MTQLQLASVHEAAHATAALSLMLPLRCVFVRDDGTGGTAYTRRLSWGEVDRWTISAYAGPEAERLVYADADEGGDLRVIAAMLRRLHLDWSDNLLAEYRCKARSLVEREQHAIMVLADELLCHRHLTADEVGVILSCSAGSVSSFGGAPEWVS